MCTSIEANCVLFVVGALWTLEDEQIVLEPTSLSATPKLDDALTTVKPLLYHTTPPKMVNTLLHNFAIWGVKFSIYTFFGLALLFCTPVSFFFTSANFFLCFLYIIYLHYLYIIYPHLLYIISTTFVHYLSTTFVHHLYIFCTSYPQLCTSSPHLLYIISPHLLYIIATYFVHHLHIFCTSSLHIFCTSSPHLLYIISTTFVHHLSTTSFVHHLST